MMERPWAMNSLYWRIFLAFWLALALILVGTVTVAVNVAMQMRNERPWVQRVTLYAQAEGAFQSGGPAGLRAWLDSLAGTEPARRTYVVLPDGHDMLGRQLPRDLTKLLERRGPLATRVPLPAIGGALVLTGADGALYHVIVTPVQADPRLFGELELPGVPTATLVIALGVSGGICFLLARYLVAPIDRLRRATRQLAAGDLNVRVRASLGGRQDDLARLADDLDTMAERVRTLLETKQRLLRDLSHELRSPLARLQLALSLALRQDGAMAERQLARIAIEADRLEQLIGRTLKLARLETPVHAIERNPVDVGELLAAIAEDASVEAQTRGCKVSLERTGPLEVQGDAELLMSCFENVVRNAVRYSPQGGEVRVSAQGSASPASGEDGSVTVLVQDSGPGVPEKDLGMIFEPFFRVDAARDHADGGVGLGLAIAARAAALHGGVIEARNAHNGGLIVSIRLPVRERAGADLAGSPGAA
jgi:two-component system sensor histidine kinase CpxA